MNKPTQKNLFQPDDLPEAPTSWERAAAGDQLAAQVVFNRPLDTAFHYLIPDDLRGMLNPGQRVKAPFGRGGRPIVGFCVGVGPVPDTGRKLKSIDSVLDREPLLSSRMLELTHWIAERYLCPWGIVLESVVPAGVKKQAGTRMITCYAAAGNLSERLKNVKLPKKQQAVVDVLLDAGQPLAVDELTAAANCGTGPLNSLKKKGFIQAVRRRSEPAATELGTITPQSDLKLNEEQDQALRTIVDCLRSQQHQTFLLHGVTGSGKTEVYIQAIREVVSYGRQAIVLVPEISLTPQTIRRFRCRFDSVAVLHSHLSDAERHWQWQQIASGAVQVIVGARSAVFAPTPQLGLIVIDEEHESTFKQETAPRYHPREVARERARAANIPLVLGTATPTLESWQRARQKKDTLISLSRRIGNRPMPPVVIVDVRNDPHITKGAAIGRALASTMRVALNDGGQVILFLNVRGYCPVLWCRACGQAVKCPHCDISLTWHKSRNVALCHSCEFNTIPPTHCPTCNAAGVRSLGVGTQRLEHEVRTRFPNYRVLRMDSDSMRKPGSHDVALQQFGAGDVQILLGTQMIAKGLDFPNVTLVGVIDADTILHQPDLRASERTFQLIAQVAGRTGRGERGGRVLVQTSSPAEPAILQAAEHDFISFAEQELGHRKGRNVPPFEHLARVILRGADEPVVQQSARDMAKTLQQTAEELGSTVRVLGPAPAPLTRLKSLFRYHLQLAHVEFEEIQRLWNEAIGRFSRVKDVEFVIDVDPYNMR